MSADRRRRPHTVAIRYTRDRTRSLVEYFLDGKRAVAGNHVAFRSTRRGRNTQGERSSSPSSAAVAERQFLHSVLGAIREVRHQGVIREVERVRVILSSLAIACSRSTTAVSRTSIASSRLLSKLPAQG